MLASKLSGGMFVAYPPEDQTSAFDLRLKNPRSAPVFMLRETIDQHPFLQVR